MDKDEILKQYKDELNKKTERYDKIMNEWGEFFFYEKHLEAREKLHSNAMKCINKLLPPELKIFLRNLCANTLGYPDEIIFYKAFGNHPEIGRSVSEKELEKEEIDIAEFDKYLDYWCLEGNIVEKQNRDGINYYYLDSLCERADITSVEELERVKASIALKEAIFQKTNMSGAEQVKYVRYVDDLLLGITPQRKEDLEIQTRAREALENPIFPTIPKELQEAIKAAANISVDD